GLDAQLETLHTARGILCLGTPLIGERALLIGALPRFTCGGHAMAQQIESHTPCLHSSHSTMRAALQSSNQFGELLAEPCIAQIVPYRFKRCAQLVALTAERCSVAAKPCVLRTCLLDRGDQIQR